MKLFLKSGPKGLSQIIKRYLIAMDQDWNFEWQHQKPQRPVVTYGASVNRADMEVETFGIGGMFSYLNVLYRQEYIEERIRH